MAAGPPGAFASVTRMMRSRRRFSYAHGLRSGYLTETARRGIPLVEAMQQSQHRSVQQAARYYNEVERQRGRAARVI